MAVPDFQSFFKPLLEIAGDGKVIFLSEIMFCEVNISVKRLTTTLKGIIVSRVVHSLLNFTLTDPDVRSYRIRLTWAWAYSERTAPSHHTHAHRLSQSRPQYLLHK